MMTYAKYIDIDSDTLFILSYARHKDLSIDRLTGYPQINDTDYRII